MTHDAFTNMIAATNGSSTVFITSGLAIVPGKSYFAYYSVLRTLFDSALVGTFVHGGCTGFLLPLSAHNLVNMGLEVTSRVDCEVQLATCKPMDSLVGALIWCPTMEAYDVGQYCGLPRNQTVYDFTSS
jgi:hypothetical protein